MKYPELIATTAMIAAASDITADGPAAPPDDHELPNDFAEALDRLLPGSRRLRGFAERIDAVLRYYAQLPPRQHA